MTMEIDAITQATPARGIGHWQTMHASLNAAYNAIAVDRQPDAVEQDVELARGYVNEAFVAGRQLLGHDGLDDAHASAQHVLPRLEQALHLLEQLGANKDAAHVTPLLEQLGVAMDLVEQVLAGVGAE